MLNDLHRFHALLSSGQLSLHSQLPKAVQLLMQHMQISLLVWHI
jgi:hypothetical protein